MNGSYGDYLRSELVSWFERGCNPHKEKMLGLEAEHFILYQDTMEAVPYSGDKGVADIIKRHMNCYPDAKLIGTVSKPLGFRTSMFSVTPEPAAQYEVSLAPKSSLEDIKQIYTDFCKTLAPILSEYGYVLCREGCQPVSNVRNLEIVPKERYHLLKRYYTLKGTRGIELMCGTASTQISVDYDSEQDFRRKFQAAFLLTPIFQMLADSAVSFEGKRVQPLKRTEIWRNTDPKRYYPPKNLFSEDFGFLSYAEHLCAVPIIMRPKGDTMIFTGDMTAEEAYHGEQLSDKDLAHIVSMVFPDVRLKQIIELRGADAMQESGILAYAALVKGLLYSDDVLDKCQEFIHTHSVTVEDHISAQNALMEEGWNGAVYGIPVKTAAQKLLSAAGDHLSNSEAEYLSPFLDLVRISPS